MSRRKSEFVKSVSFAADKLIKQVGPKPKDFHIHDGDILSAARTFGLDDATGTPSRCLVSRAIVAAAYERDNPASIYAAVEAAWEHLETEHSEAAAA